MDKPLLDRIEDIPITRWEQFTVQYACAIANNRAALQELALELQREGYTTEVAQADRGTYSLIGQRLPAHNHKGQSS